MQFALKCFFCVRHEQEVDRIAGYWRWQQVDRRLEIFESAIIKRPEIVECYLMTGDSD
jgi:hypothetical protein